MADQERTADQSKGGSATGVATQAQESSVTKVSTGASVKVEQLLKTFGPVAAVDHIDLDIKAGEFFTLLGPSGCGKTTTLRMVGGLEKPDAGSVTVGDDVVVSVSDRKFVPPDKRDMGMVFQSYALWPHMTVFENVAYPLKLRGVKRAETRDRVLDVLRLVGLEGFENRPSPLLSGGQQQRVALARALVYAPRVLLLDEPLSNLDAKLRVVMRQELKDLQQRVDVTMIYVTHDQVEALSLSDRIAIMNAGRVEQVGTPEEVYMNPATAFAQDFLGQTFRIPGTLLEIDSSGMTTIAVKGDEESRIRGRANVSGLATGDEVSMAIRPERTVLHAKAPSGRGNVVRGKIVESSFIGDGFEHKVQIGDAVLVVPAPYEMPFGIGSDMFVELPESSVVVWKAGAQVADIEAENTV
ncbi:MAG: ABC transporter ATP-binding protein [Dehalococcoidia bacterium]